jgi:Tfp pilus assembly protein FimT
MATAARAESRPDAGFTLIETVFVAAIAVTMLAVFAGYYPQAVATVQGDADMRVLQYHLKLAREMAINQRRAVQVQFVGANQVRLVRTDLPTGFTTVATAFLEHNARFQLFADQPDTPDGFGRGAAVWFSGADPVMFTSDGMFTDLTGNPVNGSVFIGQPGKPETARALTIFGPTATIRSYRWNGLEWRR